MIPAWSTWPLTVPACGRPFCCKTWRPFAWTHDIVQWLAERRLGALVAVPLIAEDEVVGVLEAIAPLGRPFDTGELDTLHIITGQLALGVSNARLFTPRPRGTTANLGHLEQQRRRHHRAGCQRPGAGRQSRRRTRAGLCHHRFGRQAAVRSHPERRVECGRGQCHQSRSKRSRRALKFNSPTTPISSATCRPSSIRPGRLTGWVAVMQDITRFKETERMKSDMILTASHDLRNPVQLDHGRAGLAGQARRQPHRRCRKRRWI